MPDRGQCLRGTRFATFPGVVFTPSSLGPPRVTLQAYRRKRDFQKTREPEGRVGRKRSTAQFVVQKHAASHLHYDFRLELDGVLKSWAVPKGPSLDPAVRALAMEVEDHPLEYGSFEGTIPQGQYGGGTVMLWDRGTWEPEGDAAAGLKKGHLRFVLRGKRLKGGWSLIRMKADGERSQWLLIKRDDAQAVHGDAHGIEDRYERSVASRRTMDGIAAGDKEWGPRGERTVKRPSAGKNGKPRRSPSGAATSKVRRKHKPVRRPASVDEESLPAGAVRRALPKEFAPQLATLAERPPEGEEWLHELKFDGYRIVAVRRDEQVRLITRNGNDWTAKFKAVAAAVAPLTSDGTILDGELVALRPDGVPDFQRLQNAIREHRDGELVYYVFDMPFLGGFDLRAVPLVERKRLLADWIRARDSGHDGVVRYSEHVVGRGAEVLAEACRNGLEGIVSKRSDAPYECRRSTTWLKSKCHGRQEFVIGGYTKPSGARAGFGSLLVGYFDDEQTLHYCGKVGTGFSTATLKDLKKRMDEEAAGDMPFDDVPAAIRRTVKQWVRPRLVAEIEFTEWTGDGRLRHPSFQGLREDKKAMDVKREQPKMKARSRKIVARRNGVAHKSAEVAGVTLTHPDRKLFADSDVTKLEVAEYYEAVADWMLPHVVDRPLTIVRCPGGAAGECFFQKHWTAQLPEAVGRVAVPTKAGREWYVTASDLAGIVALVQISAVEIHPWSARSDDLDRPDQVIFDLDPGPGVTWKAIVEGAVALRKLLDRLELESFVRTSGGKGLHVVVPIDRRNTWDDVGRFADELAAALVRAAPDRYVDNMRKELRKGKIFVDHFRNRRGSTSVASYSTRGRPGAPVAVPVAWSELPKLTSAAQFSVADVPPRLKRLGHARDPWRKFFKSRQRLTKATIESAGELNR